MLGKELSSYRGLSNSDREDSDDYETDSDDDADTNNASSEPVPIWTSSFVRGLSASGLEKLDMSHQSISEDTLICLLDKPLRSIKLFDCKLISTNPDSAMKACDDIAVSACLEDISFEGMNMGDSLFCRLSKGLSTLPGLTSLNLARNKLSVQSASAMARIMEHSVAIQSLDLNYNKIEDSGIDALCLSFRKCSTLRELGFNHVCLRESGLLTYIAVLPSISIKKLTIDCLSAGSADALSTAVEASTTLLEVFVQMLELSREQKLLLRNGFNKHYSKVHWKLM